MRRELFTFVAVAVFVAACGVIGDQLHTEELEESLSVGDAPTLNVNNFGGKVTVRPGDRGTIRVTATKRADRKEDLDEIDVEIVGRETGVEVKTDRPSGLANLSVLLEITAPADTRVDVQTGGGDVDVRGIDGDVSVTSGGGSIDIRDSTGDIDASTGGGSIDVRGAEGRVALDAGGGNIDFQGRPQGDCSFATGGGSIKLRVPKDMGLQVDLGTGGGEVQVDLPVDGNVAKRTVIGTIGDGDEAVVFARTGGGDIRLSGE